MQGMSVAPRALSLSIGIGGLAAMVQLPMAIAQQGDAVLPGFFTAIVLLALPAYLAELTSWRLHGGSLLITMFDGMRAGHVRMSWAIGGVLLVIVLGLLATLACFAAGIIGEVASTIGVGNAKPVELRYTWLQPINLVYWSLLAVALLLPSLPGPWQRPLRHFGGLILGGLFLACIGIALWSSESTPTAALAENGIAGFLHGVSIGAMASLMGLGVMHTAIGRYADTEDALSDAREVGVVLLASAGMIMWSIALLGIGQWVLEHSPIRASGLGFFVSTLPASSLPTAAKVGICLAAMLILLRATVLIVDVIVLWLTTRAPRLRYIATLAVVGGMALLTELLDVAIDESIDAREQMSLVRVIPLLASTLLPLVALVMMSMFTRSLPPGPMLWAQRMPLPVAAAMYFYWRYPLRLFLLILLLYSSGVGQFLIEFWIPDDYA